MSRRRVWFLVSAPLLMASACAVAWYCVGITSGIEGAYFSRTVGARAYVVSGNGWLANMLAAAALTLLAVAVVVAILLRVRPARTTPRVALVLTAAAVVVCLASGLRALALRDSGMSVIDAYRLAWVKDTATDTGVWISQPDVLLGVSAALALAAASVAVAGRRSTGITGS